MPAVGLAGYLAGIEWERMKWRAWCVSAVNCEARPHANTYLPKLCAEFSTNLAVAKDTSADSVLCARSLESGTIA